MQCFVAMAFRPHDTNELYERAICPALGGLGVAPRRVDRVVHNENIDNRILEEIRSADFAIVDLTYARPSVYYEAGYAEREIPVIYTIRADHLVPNVGDEQGALRLHFDLSMRNIIAWTADSLDEFVDALAERVRHVMEPLIAAEERSAAEREQASTFSSLPIVERSKILFTECSEILEARGFVSRDYVQKKLGRSTRSLMNFRDDFFRAAHGIYQIVNVDTHTKLEEVPHHYTREPDYNLNVFANLGAITRIEEHWFILCPHKVSFQAVCHKMEDYAPSIRDQTLESRADLQVPIVPSGYTGDVILDDQDVYASVAERFFGGTRCQGYLTKTPPIGSSFTRAKIFKDYQFVYGMPLREVHKLVAVHILDDLSSRKVAARILQAAVNRLGQNAA